MVDKAVEEMTLVTGQKAVKTFLQKTFLTSSFVRMPIGCRVTLRRENMYDFLDRLITALPRIVTSRVSKQKVLMVAEASLSVLRSS